MHCFASAHPKTWYKFLSWAEFWYNSCYHTSIHTTPFKEVYGRDPPSLFRYETGSTANFDLESMLLERDKMLDQLKAFLSKAQECMKRSADKHRRELEFSVGDKVFLKLWPYRQHSLIRRVCQKLSAKFYGPFEIIERIGKVAYRLRFPEGSRVHNVFHVSQLKNVVGSTDQVTSLPTTFSDQGEFILVSTTILDTRYNPEGYLEVLVQWESLLAHEASWILGWEFARQYPVFPLEDKLRLIGRGNDMLQRVYFRKKRHEKGKTLEERKLEGTERGETLDGREALGQNTLDGRGFETIHG